SRPRSGRARTPRRTPFSPVGARSAAELGEPYEPGSAPARRRRQGSTAPARRRAAGPAAVAVAPVAADRGAAETFSAGIGAESAERSDAGNEQTVTAILRKPWPREVLHNCQVWLPRQRWPNTSGERLHDSQEHRLHADKYGPAEAALGILQRMQISQRDE